MIWQKYICTGPCDQSRPVPADCSGHSAPDYYRRPRCRTDLAHQFAAAQTLFVRSCLVQPSRRKSGQAGVEKGLPGSLSLEKRSIRSLGNDVCIYRCNASLSGASSLRTKVKGNSSPVIPCYTGPGGDSVSNYAYQRADRNKRSFNINGSPGSRRWAVILPLLAGLRSSFLKSDAFYLVPASRGRRCISGGRVILGRPDIGASGRHRANLAGTVIVSILRRRPSLPVY